MGTVQAKRENTVACHGHSSSGSSIMWIHLLMTLQRYAILSLCCLWHVVWFYRFIFWSKQYSVISWLDQTFVSPVKLAQMGTDKANHIWYCASSVHKYNNTGLCLVIWISQWYHFVLEQVIKDDMWPNPLQYFLAPDIEENGYEWVLDLYCFCLGT